MQDKPSRRAVIGVPAAMLLSSTACAVEPGPSVGSKTLVAYFTRSGNTRVIAELLQRDLGADLFQIEAATPYPADYEATVAQASREREAGFKPPLKATARAISAYDTLYLGFPVWGSAPPPVIRSFISAHDLKRMILRPFITHGGFGVGSSLSVLAADAPTAQIQKAFVMEADQERRTIGLVRDWTTPSGG